MYLVDQAATTVQALHGAAGCSCFTIAERHLLLWHAEPQKTGLRAMHALHEVLSPRIQS